MTAARIAKLEQLLARVQERRDVPRVLPVAAAAAAAPKTVATTPPPPPVAVPEVSVPRQPTPAFGLVRPVSEAPTHEQDLQESTFVSRTSSTELVPDAAQSHARIATAARAPVEPEPMLELDVEPDPEESEASVESPVRAEAQQVVTEAPISSAREVDPSLEADVAEDEEAPPQSTKQLATSPPPRTSSPPDSATKKAGSPIVTRGVLPDDASGVIEFAGSLEGAERSFGDLLEATLQL